MNLFPNVELETFLKLSALVNSSMGFARTRLVEVQEGKVRLVFSDNWEASALGKGMFSNPQCAFTKGYWKGLTEANS